MITKLIHKTTWLTLFGMVIFFIGCRSDHDVASLMYTCPMPQDSFISKQHGQCPKCGMDLVLMEDHSMHLGHDMKAPNMDSPKGYTCPMHPAIQSDTAGTCPICGMRLEKIKSGEESKSITLNTLLKPSNQQVIANVPMVHAVAREEDIQMDAYGYITYDTRQTGVITTNFSGRIEKLYVQYRYQKVNKGQRIMDIYSPELLTAQENLLFLIKNDPENEVLLNATKQKLQLLGMSLQQLNEVIKTGQLSTTITIFTNYTGHIHESTVLGMDNSQSNTMPPSKVITESMTIKEGMYVQKGQTLFAVNNPDRAWALLNIFTGQAAMVKVGNKVHITPETNPADDFSATINYIEPVFRDGSKTLSARVYFNNSIYRIPMGSQVKAIVFAGNRSANWLPEESVLSLGLDNVVFVRTGEAFMARKVEIGMTHKHLVQILNGLENNEAVAANSQYLVDSESFIKTN